MMNVLDGCQNPKGCNRIAITDVELVEEATKRVVDTVKLCAYCEDGLSPAEGYYVR